MRLLFAVFLLFIFGSAAHALEARIKDDGTVEFAISRIGTTPIWTTEEKNRVQTSINAFSATSPVTLPTLTPAAFEVNLSTCLIIIVDGEIEIVFENYSDWIGCQTRAGLRRKIRKIRTLINSFSDLPASATAEIRERMGWVLSYYNTLP